MIFRSMIRQPLGVFEGYKAFCHDNAKLSNTCHIMGLTLAVMLVGAGAEKMICRHELHKNVNSYRNLDRSMIPYFFADYSYKYKRL